MNYENDLYLISEAVLERLGEDSSMPGYGANFENDVFSIHRYCWCDQTDCPWCEDGAPNFLHKPSGLAITWYKYIGRGMEVSEQVGWRRWRDIANECLASLEAPASA